MIHPRDVLLGAKVAPFLPVCDHYCGVEARMRKSLALQAELAQEFGACVFDVTLDCEDGAPVGGEIDHAFMVAALAEEALGAINDGISPAQARVAVRVHPVDHSAFENDIVTTVGRVGGALCHVMLPKVESLHDIERALLLIDAACQGSPKPTLLPVHALIESPAAVQQAASIASHPRVQSLSFGLMDFVSAHGGAIPESAMTYGGDGVLSKLDQFHHPLVLQAKLTIAAACHAAGKTPSHCVVTEFRDPSAVQTAARWVSQALGYTRMWSIHPDQIRPILAAFAPDRDEVAKAGEIILAAQAANWAPISVSGMLHDRASYRYFWQLLERANRTGRLLPNDPAHHFFAC